MPKDINDEFQDLINQAGQLDDVPKDVALEFEETLSKLLREEEPRKRPWITTATFLLAASFLGLFGMGIISSTGPSPKVESAIDTLPTPINSMQTDILAADEVGVVTNQDVMVVKSGLDYFGKSKASQFPFRPKSNFGSLKDLESNLQKCLTQLGLSQTVSVVDSGMLNNLEITAIWTALDSDSWAVSILAEDCQPVEEILITNS